MKAKAASPAGRSGFVVSRFAVVYFATLRFAILLFDGRCPACDPLAQPILQPGPVLGSGATGVAAGVDGKVGKLGQNRKAVHQLLGNAGVLKCRGIIPLCSRPAQGVGLAINQ